MGHAVSRRGKAGRRTLKQIPFHSSRTAWEVLRNSLNPARPGLCAGQANPLHIHHGKINFRAACSSIVFSPLGSSPTSVITERDAPLTRIARENPAAPPLNAILWAARHTGRIIICGCLAVCRARPWQCRRPGILFYSQSRACAPWSSGLRQGGVIFLQLCHVAFSRFPVPARRRFAGLAPSAVPIAGLTGLRRRQARALRDSRARSRPSGDGRVEIYPAGPAITRCECGFRGVAIHGAMVSDRHFLRSRTNRPPDRYGGSIEPRPV